jgi:hypothetical protein
MKDGEANTRILGPGAAPPHSFTHGSTLDLGSAKDNMGTKKKIRTIAIPILMLRLIGILMNRVS